MNKNTGRFMDSCWILIFPVVFYLTGFFLMPKENIEFLKQTGYATQEEYIWTDNDGEEHEDTKLINIDGIGVILTYRTMYLSLIGMFVPALAIGRILFGEEVNEIKCLIFCNSLIGIALLILTNRAHIPSTTMYWLGIIAASFCIKLGERKQI